MRVPAAASVPAIPPATRPALRNGTTATWVWLLWSEGRGLWRVPRSGGSQTGLRCRVFPAAPLPSPAPGHAGPAPGHAGPAPGGAVPGASGELARPARPVTPAPAGTTAAPQCDIAVALGTAM
jgi:hypothetical protein